MLVGRPLRARGDRVNVDVEEPASEALEVIESDLLTDLAPRRLEDGGIARFDVAPRLEPKAELAVEDEQHLGAIGAQHEGARGEVAGLVAIPREGHLAAREQGAHPLDEARLTDVGGCVSREQRG